MITLKKWSLLQTGKVCSKLGAFAIGAVLLASCGDDDGSVTPNDNTGSSNVRIVQVDATSDEVTLRNFGDADADISGYFFCNQRSYVAFSATTNDGSDLILAEDEEITFTITIADNASDVAIYNRGGAFDAASALVDFMQFGASFSGNSGREDVAVSKGIWTAGEFIEDGSPFVYEGDGTTNGASTWDGEEVDNSGMQQSNVRLTLIDPANDLVTLKNFGTGEADISGYFFCRRKNYVGLGSLTPVSGDLMLAADEEVQFTLSIDDASSDFALYANNSGFGSADNIVDFFQFGDDLDTDGRVDVAVTAEIWNADEFVNGVGPYSYTGDGATNGADQWSVTAEGSANVRLLSVDPSEDKVVLKNFGTASQDISGYFFCLRKVYPSLSGSDITSGNLILAPNEEVEVAVSINDTSSDVGLYMNNSGFANSANILDFMQFGEDVDSNGRENVAVAAGIWTENEFVENPGPFAYSGDGDQNGASFWD